MILLTKLLDMFFETDRLDLWLMHAVDSANDVLVTGPKTPEMLQEKIDIVHRFQSYSDDEMEALFNKVALSTLIDPVPLQYTEYRDSQQDKGQRKGRFQWPLKERQNQNG